MNPKGRRVFAGSDRFILMESVVMVESMLYQKGHPGDLKGHGNGLGLLILLPRLKERSSFDVAGTLSEGTSSRCPEIPPFWPVHFIDDQTIELCCWMEKVGHPCLYTAPILVGR